MMDILISQAGMYIQGGDFVVGDATEQQKLNLLTVQEGELKQFPTKGIGIHSILLSEDGNLKMKHRIRKMFTEDGATIKKLEFVNNQLILDAKY